LGDARRAIGFHQQHLAVAREIGDRQGEAVRRALAAQDSAALGAALEALPEGERATVVARLQEAGIIGGLAVTEYTLSAARR